MLMLKTVTVLEAISKRRRTARPAAHTGLSKNTIFAATHSAEDALVLLDATANGLTVEQATERLNAVGPNTIEAPTKTLARRIADAFIDPFAGILAALALVSLYIDVLAVPEPQRDPSTVIVIGTMLLVSGGMKFIQEARSGNAAEALKDLVSNTCTALRDGERIEGYLTLPVGKTLRNAKNLPVVVNPHGGPWARDSWGFNPEAQFLANRGYAVLQMNFRGSTGFGRRFTEIAFGKWGQEMQDDITDGVNWLIGKGIADPARIAIYGGSYGGYATLQGIVKDPDLYACAIDYVGVSNLFSFLNTIPPYWKPLLDQMYEMVGNPETQQEMLRENSPALNAGRIKTPLLVVQGANDPRVNINESNQMVEALRARGVEVDYMVKDNEGHGFHNEENRFDFYRAMEKFFGKHLKGVRPEGDIVPESCRR